PGTPNAQDRSLAALPGVLAQLGEGDDAAANLLELLRTASRHCRKLVDCRSARIWLARRGGARLVARDFPEDGDAGPTVMRFALDNALLYEQTERRSLEKEVLLEVVKTLSGSLDFDELMGTILKSLRQVVHYDAAAVYLVNRRTLALEQVTDVGYPEGSDEAF